MFLDGWREVKAVSRNAYSNKKLLLSFIVIRCDSVLSIRRSDPARRELLQVVGVHVSQRGDKREKSEKQNRC